MKPGEFEKLLIGKTIAKIEWHSYLGWSMCVDKIIFIDGSYLEPYGSADECIFGSFEDKDGHWYVAD